ncbi:hypothetical protein Pmar_PMAR008249 [Perkinsus marinus ATCC 50983]|uniref:Kinesin motor domain-containing protein n=1 Tax=Perkinsus marinus (strain ATCC 50983 / TXsc) TaxID=423536 RepID=C5LNQ1_PERM5|nr:hypothetical protein Pmar_PMAR008249 [Perkinsus marinus ATCC 50983]EER01670.1 hypothetical protein Pmar_PMAR008249 [Perkinsus marinus ATCC 50983]|eukprot:XP_002768952.1 hypothetical protein Pmar_PMAR008249 [Perkinsus marinus ATCC 50983]
MKIFGRVKVLFFEVSLNSRLNLVDLSGSERSGKTGAEGERLKEGTAINQSLTNLGICIRELSEKMGKLSSGGEYHIPFRNSKLTFLLKDSLCGNSRTFMIATISPSSSETEETLGTLRFASSVKTIKTSARQNFGTQGLVQELQAEIKNLKREVEGYRQIAFEKERNQIDIVAHQKLLEELRMREKTIDSMKERYRIAPNALLTVGSAADNAVVLQGLGITRHLAAIETTDGMEVVLKLCGAASKCRLSRVNPEAVREATKVLGELCSAVDEANEISEDLKPVHKYSFEIGSMFSGDDENDGNKLLMECPLYGDPWREVTLEELEELRTEAVVADRKSAVLRESARKVAMLSGIIGKFKKHPKAAVVGRDGFEGEEESNKVGEMVRKAFGDMRRHIGMIGDLKAYPFDEEPKICFS